MHIGFIVQKSLERVWHVETNLKMLDFPKKRDKTSCLLRNTQHVSFHVYRSFGIIHVKCYVKLYLVFVFPKRHIGIDICVDTCILGCVKISKHVTSSSDKNGD